MRCLIGFLALALIGAPVSAQDAWFGSGDRMAGYSIANPLGTGRVYIQKVLNVDTTGAYVAAGGSSIPTGTAGSPNAAVITVQGITGGTPEQMQGNIPSGSADSGNPVKVGGVYNTTEPTLISGQRGDVQIDPRGNLLVSTFTAAPVVADGLSTAVTCSSRYQMDICITQYVRGETFNGTTWNLQRGDVTGAWTGGHSTIATGQVSVGTTATLVAAARTGRQKLGVTVTSAVQCAFGASGVTLTTGWPLAATAYVSDNWDSAAALYGVCASTATVGYREQY